MTGLPSHTGVQTRHHELEGTAVAKAAAGVPAAEDPKPPLGYDRRMKTSLGQALDFLAAGDWQKAHEIVQNEKSTMGSWLHGIVHILEGDRKNAQGWYRRAEREFPGMDAAQAEIAAARRTIGEP